MTVGEARNVIALENSDGMERRQNMNDSQRLLDHADQIHTTEMGVDRIKRNLHLDTEDIVAYCKNKILDKNCKITRKEKNWYCEVDDVQITVHAYRYTIITAHKIKMKRAQDNQDNIL